MALPYLAGCHYTHSGHGDVGQQLHLHSQRRDVSGDLPGPDARLDFTLTGEHPASQATEVAVRAVATHLKHCIPLQAGNELL